MSDGDFPPSVALPKISTVRKDLDAAINAVRELEKVSPIDRRTLNGAIDDAAADLSRLQVAMQRLMERTQETTDAT